MIPITKEKQNIPKEWRWVKLGSVSDITNGKTNTQDAVVGGEYPLFDRSVEVKRSNKYLFDKTAIILPGEGAEFVPRFYSGKFDLHQRAYAIFPKENVYSLFLFQYLYANREVFIQKSVGSTVRSLRLPIIQSVDILLPPSSEQQKIAEILGMVDEEIAKTQEVIEATEKLKCGLMQQLFTRGIKGTEFRKLKLGDLCDFQTGKLNSNKAVDGGEYPFFTCAQETFAINQYSFDQKAILLAGNNAAGKYSVKYYEGKFDAYQRTYVISIKNENDLSYPYLKEVLNTRLNELRDSSVGSSTKFLTLKLLQNLSISLPPISEQREIAEILSSINEKIAVNGKLKAKLVLLKKGLMQDLLSGKVRVNINFKYGK